MANEKAEQRSRVIYEYGILMQPFQELARSKISPIANAYRIAVAKNHAGDAAWRNTVREYTTFADDVVFHGQFQKISHIPERLRGYVLELIASPKFDGDLKLLQTDFGQLMKVTDEEFFRRLDEVPIEWKPVIFSANTPFTAYLQIKDCLAVVKKRFHYFDRYLKPEFFELFLRQTPRDAQVRLVTTQGKNSFGVAGVLAASNLARQEFSDYQLIEVDPASLHDRNLRVDDQMFSLGPGVDRAGMALTNFGPSDSSPAAHAAFDQLIAAGNIVHQS